jgi:hypothetical protein
VQTGTIEHFIVPVEQSGLKSFKNSSGGGKCVSEQESHCCS